MTTIAEWLNALGAHFIWIAVGCLEIIAAIVLVALRPRLTHRQKRRTVRVPEAERALQQALRRRSDNACIVLRRSDTMPVYAAGNIEPILGVTLAQLQDDIACVLQCLDRPEAGQRVWQKYQTWDGEESLEADLQMHGSQWLRVSVQRSEDGVFDLFFFARRTKEHEKEQSYEQRLAKAEAASQFKTSFLFRMSHEIRTPMNGIAGMLTLAEGKLEPDHPAMQYLTKADELSDHLLSLINDILDMSRIEAGKVELEKRAFSLRALGERLYNMFAKTLETKGVRYAVDYEELSADWVLGDELRIGQVVINFLSNAVKFTSEGEIVVTFRQMLLQDGRVDLMIRVHDTGTGMNPEFISRIFRPFEQEDSSTTRRYGGTGLGMAISDQLVKLMGGQIMVESMPGKGSDFTLFLSLPVVQEGSQVEMEAAPDSAQEQQTVLPAGCRILMAEDNEVNAMIAVEILTQRGGQVDVAENGKLAVEQFASEPEGYYDVILMDIQMPVMDGREAAKAIRAMKRADAATVPIFALSADAFVEDERLSRQSGMNGHLTKPIDFDVLCQTIQSSLQGRG